MVMDPDILHVPPVIVYEIGRSDDNTQSTGLVEDLVQTFSERLHCKWQNRRA
jgi:hypothetical protein